MVKVVQADGRPRSDVFPWSDLVSEHVGSGEPSKQDSLSFLFGTTADNRDRRAFGGGVNRAAWNLWPGGLEIHVHGRGNPGHCRRHHCLVLPVGSTGASEVVDG